MHHQNNIISSNSVSTTTETSTSDNDEQRQELILTVNEVDCQDFPYDDVLSLEAAVTKTEKPAARRALTSTKKSSSSSTRSDSSCSSTTLSENKGYATRDSPRYYKEQVDPSALSHLSEMQDTIILGDHLNSQQQLMYQFNFNDCPLASQTLTLTTPPPTSGQSSVMPSIHRHHQRGGRGMLYELCKPDSDEPLTIPTPPPIASSPSSGYHANSPLMTSSTSQVVSIVPCGGGSRKESAESLPESCDTVMTSSSPSDNNSGVMEQILGGVRTSKTNQLMKNLSNGTLHTIIEELQEQLLQKTKDVEDKDNELNYWKTKAEILQKKWEQLVANGDHRTTASGRFRITPERSNSRNSNSGGGTRPIVTSQPKRRRESSNNRQPQQNKRARTESSTTTAATTKTENNKDSNKRTIDPHAVRLKLRAVAESRISSKETANNNQQSSSPTIAPPLRHNHHHNSFHPTTTSSQHRSASMSLPVLPITKQPAKRAPQVATTSRSNSEHGTISSSVAVTAAFVDQNNHVFEPSMTSSSSVPSPLQTSSMMLMKVQTPDLRDNNDNVVTDNDTESIFSIMHPEYNTPPLTSSSSSYHDNNIYSPSTFSTSSLSSSKWSPFSATQASPLSCHHDVIMQQQPNSADPQITNNHHQELLPLTAKKSNSHPNLSLMHHHHASLERKESSRSNDGRLMKALGNIILPDDDDADDDDEVQRVTCNHD